MKKIAILTWLHNGNYGTVLQAYALQKFLRNEGYNVQNIDLLPTVVQKFLNLIKQGNPPYLFLEKLEGYLARRACPNPISLKVRDGKFNNFLKENLNLTKRYSVFSDLKELKNMYDVYICGSDQIWSPTYFSPSYFLDFTDNDRKRIAYACSFGINEIPVRKTERTRKLIERFNAVSVREESGRTIISKLMDKDVRVNVDPTFLLNEDNWKEVVADRIVEDNYIFCYFLSYNHNYWVKVQQIADDKKLKLVLVPTTKETYNIDARIFADAGPSEWLSLIKHASLVATDSFHCCVFSIIHRRNFMVFKRFSDKKSNSRNTRVYNLLNTYELGQCLVDILDQYEPTAITKERYDRVLSEVEKNVKGSKNWLTKSIDEDISFPF